MTPRSVQLGPVLLRAELAATDAKQRTAAVVWYTGAEIARFDFFEGEYSLRFDMQGADLSRLNGGPLTRNHSHDLADVVGVVEKAWIADGAGNATVRFSDRADVADLFADVRAGIITSISMEAAILELEDATPKGDRKKAYVAKKWQPMALSLVPVGADANASIAALANQPTHACVIRGDTMSDELDDTTDDGIEPTAEELAAAKREKREENRRLVREGKIRHWAKSYELGDLWCERMLRAEHLSLEEIVRDATGEHAKRTPHIGGYVDVIAEHDSPGARLAMMADGLAARATGAAPSGAGHRYADRTLVELAYETLSWRGMHHGLDVRHHAGRIVQLSLTTSDFPLLLANSGNKLLANAYEAAAPVYRLLARREDLKDFKQNSYLKVGDFPVPLEVGEGGEITFGAFSEDGEVWALATYGRIVRFSRQALINDDLAAFSRMMGGAGERIAQFENGLFFTLLTSGTSNNGPTMADTTQFFSTGHANLAGSGTAIDVTTLGAGRAAMQKQTSLDSIKLNILPRYLLVSPDKRTIAEQYTTQITPAASSNVNPFPGRLEVVSDANLTGNPWYLWADPGRVAAAVYGHLAGETGPRIETRLGFEREGLEMKACVDFACAFVEHRAAWRNPGA